MGSNELYVKHVICRHELWAILVLSSSLVSHSSCFKVILEERNTLFSVPVCCIVSAFAIWRLHINSTYRSTCISMVGAWNKSLAVYNQQGKCKLWANFCVCWRPVSIWAPMNPGHTFDVEHMSYVFMSCGKHQFYGHSLSYLSRCLEHCWGKTCPYHRHHINMLV